jgi:hypothetical protein
MICEWSTNRDVSRRSVPRLTNLLPSWKAIESIGGLGVSFVLLFRSVDALVLALGMDVSHLKILGFFPDEVTQQPKQLITYTAKTMKVPIGLLLLFARLATVIEAFTASSSPPGRYHLQQRWFASTQEEGATTAVKAPKSKTQQLGLLTFDLDDTLYPIELVVRAANGTSNFGGGLLVWLWRPATPCCSF